MSLLSGMHLSVQFSMSCLARSVFMLMDSFPNETPFRIESVSWFLSYHLDLEFYYLGRSLPVGGHFS